MLDDVRWYDRFGSPEKCCSTSAREHVEVTLGQAPGCCDTQAEESLHGVASRIEERLGRALDHLDVLLGSFPADELEVEKAYSSDSETLHTLYQRLGHIACDAERICDRLRYARGKVGIPRHGREP